MDPEHFNWIIWAFFFKLSLPVISLLCRWSGDPDNPSGGNRI